MYVGWSLCTCICQIFWSFWRIMLRGWVSYLVKEFSKIDGGVCIVMRTVIFYDCLYCNFCRHCESLTWCRVVLMIFLGKCGWFGARIVPSLGLGIWGQARERGAASFQRVRSRGPETKKIFSHGWRQRAEGQDGQGTKCWKIKGQQRQSAWHQQESHEHSMQSVHADLHVHHERGKVQRACWSQAPEDGRNCMLPSPQARCLRILREEGVTSHWEVFLLNGDYSHNTGFYSHRHGVFVRLRMPYVQLAISVLSCIMCLEVACHWGVSSWGKVLRFVRWASLEYCSASTSHA